MQVVDAARSTCTSQISAAPVATSLCMLSDTSCATTSGQPSWLTRAVSSGKKTFCASADRVSSGASVSSPCVTCGTRGGRQRDSMHCWPHRLCSCTAGLQADGSSSPMSSCCHCPALLRRSSQSTPFCASASAAAWCSARFAQEDRAGCASRQAQCAGVAAACTADGHDAARCSAAISARQASTELSITHRPQVLAVAVHQQPLRALIFQEAGDRRPAQQQSRDKRGRQPP